MKQFRYIFVIVGLIIGAGFATGKEIVEFFAKYGYWSLIMIIPLFFVFYLFIYLVLKNAKKPEENKNKILNNTIVKILMLAMFLLISAAMFSAGTDFFNVIGLGNFRIPVMFLLAVLCFLILLGGFKKILDFNNILVPIIILLFFFQTIYAIASPVTADRVFQIADYPYIMLPIKTVLYVCLNVILSYYVYDEIGQKEDIKPKTVALVSSIILCVLITLAIVCLNLNGSAVIDSAMPFITIANLLGAPMNYIFSITILLGIITTLISTIYTYNLLLSEYIKNKYACISISVASTFIVGLLGFSSIVEYVYPAVGVFGLVLLIILIVRS